MNTRQEIISFAKTLERENEIAWYLWMDLPSYKETKKFHGDYADEFQPELEIIMEEARYYLQDKMNPTDKRLEENSFYHCACGEEDHEEKVGKDE